MAKTTRTWVWVGLTALAVAGTMGAQGYAADRGAAREAARDARRAARAMKDDDRGQAIRFAEAAVAAQPRAAGYRMLLGQGYLRAGRFASAAAAFADVLALDPTQGRAALNLSLMRVALGDWAGARVLLQQHAATIPAADLGLAIALAGDPAGGVQVLMEAARSSGADAKIRQNLALSLALSGQWAAARTVAAADMSPADVDARMEEWAVFAQPRSADQQVATLLRVRPVADPGLPVALALTAPSPVTVTPAGMPVTAAPTIAAGMPVSTAAVEVPEAVANMPGTAGTGVVFGPRREVVQPLPVPVIRAMPGAARLALPGARGAAMTGRAAVDPVRARAFLAQPTPVAGGWHVQLGAFEDAAVARDAWARIGRRHGLSGRTPAGALVQRGGASFYRLSVGGLSRGEADRLCRRVRTGGGACFVRAAAGDRIARWAVPTGGQLALRGVTPAA